MKKFCPGLNQTITLMGTDEVKNTKKGRWCQNVDDNSCSHAAKIARRG